MREQAEKAVKPIDKILEAILDYIHHPKRGDIASADELSQVIETIISEAISKAVIEKLGEVKAEIEDSEMKSWDDQVLVVEIIDAEIEKEKSR